MQTVQPTLDDSLGLSFYTVVHFFKIRSFLYFNRTQIANESFSQALYVLN